MVTKLTNLKIGKADSFRELIGCHVLEWARAVRTFGLNLVIVPPDRAQAKQRTRYGAGVLISRKNWGKTQCSPSGGFQRGKDFFTRH